MPKLTPVENKTLARMLRQKSFYKPLRAVHGFRWYCSQGDRLAFVALQGAWLAGARDEQGLLDAALAELSAHDPATDPLRHYQPMYRRQVLRG